MAIIIDLAQDEETLVRTAAGQAGVDPATYIINLLRRHLLHQEEKSSAQLADNHSASGSKRVGNLHPGNFQISDDFDAPLPDEFWLGKS